MTTPSNAERTKAAKLRKRRAEGKTLSPEAARWLASYEARATISRAKRQADGVRAPEVRPVVRGPQLGLPTAAQTLKPDDSPFVPVGDPGWVPVMPDHEPPGVDHASPAGVGGAEPPPVAGTPLVDDATAAPTGDPTAARNFGQLVAFLTGLGLGAAREMMSELAIPEEVKALLASDELTTAALGTVAQAGERLAMKYGFRSMPMPDEATVALALAGSAFAVFKNAKRKMLKAAPAAPVSVTERAAPTPPPDALGDLAELWT